MCLSDAIPDLAFLESRGRVQDEFVIERRVDLSIFDMQRARRRDLLGAWMKGDRSL